MKTMILTHEAGDIFMTTPCNVFENVLTCLMLTKVLPKSCRKLLQEADVKSKEDNNCEYRLPTGKKRS